SGQAFEGRGSVCPGSSAVGVGLKNRRSPDRRRPRPPEHRSIHIHLRRLFGLAVGCSPTATTRASPSPPPFRESSGQLHLVEIRIRRQRLRLPRLGADRSRSHSWTRRRRDPTATPSV